MDELTRKWLWMEAMNYALEEIKWKHRRAVYPEDRESEWRTLDLEQMDKAIFRYAVDNWQTPPLSGRGRAHGKYSIGQSIQTDAKGVTSTYKEMVVHIPWSESIKFIQDLIGASDEQLDMFEILAKKA